MLDDAQADLRAPGQLRPLVARLQRLIERMNNSEMALGRSKGLEGVSEALSARFLRPRKGEPAHRQLLHEEAPLWRGFPVGH